MRSVSPGPSSIRSTLFLLTFATAMLCGLFPADVRAATKYCQSANSDSDGDGWGWENHASCVMPGTRVDRQVKSVNSRKLCESVHSDPDGDGWGWENKQSCRIDSTASSTTPDRAVTTVRERPVCQRTDSDPDGDGWGWENKQSCRVAAKAATGKPKIDIEEVQESTVCSRSDSDPDGDGFGYENGEVCRLQQSSEITDLILIAGQSNVLGAGTSVNPTLDAPDNRVFAYTSKGWQIAELYQAWDRGFYPGPGKPNADKDIIYNNLALHFGKRLVELDPSRVVGFVIASEPGKGISYWESGAPGLNRVKQKALEALNALPYKAAFDGVLWHQGETDWSFSGTRDPEITSAVPVDYYRRKLNALIANFRSESWHSPSAPFICGETIRATGVNKRLKALNTDADPLTGCVPGFGLKATFDDGSHFNAASLRKMGKWYAEKYLEMTR